LNNYLTVLRGQHTLFKDLLPDTLPETSTKKGRSSELHAKRNEAISARYYFYLSFTDMRYEKIVTTLADEFFLSPFTVPEIIQENLDYIKSLKQDQPSKRFFSVRWAQYTWP